jgi:hypothetical protein
MENGVGSEALTGEGCWGGQSRGVVAALSSFQCSCARKKGEGEKGVVATVTRREKQRMEGLTRYGRPRQRVRVEGHHRRQTGGVAEGADKEVRSDSELGRGSLR